MRYRDKLKRIIKENKSSIIDKYYAGGVFACPCDYFISSELSDFCNNCREGMYISCEDCWSRKYMNESINYELINLLTKGVEM